MHALDRRVVRAPCSARRRRHRHRQRHCHWRRRRLSDACASARRSALAAAVVVATAAATVGSAARSARRHSSCTSRRRACARQTSPSVPFVRPSSNKVELNLSLDFTCRSTRYVSASVARIDLMQERPYRLQREQDFVGSSALVSPSKHHGHNDDGTTRTRSARQFVRSLARLRVGRVRGFDRMLLALSSVDLFVCSVWRFGVDRRPLLSIAHAVKATRRLAVDNLSMRTAHLAHGASLGARGNVGARFLARLRRVARPSSGRPAALAVGFRAPCTCAPPLASVAPSRLRRD